MLVKFCTSNFESFALFFLYSPFYFEQIVTLHFFLSLIHFLFLVCDLLLFLVQVQKCLTNDTSVFEISSSYTSPSIFKLSYTKLTQNN